MYARNNREPSTVSCGTPEVTGAELDELPSTTTLCIMSDKKLDYRLTICGFGDDAGLGCLMSEMLFKDKNSFNSCGKVLVDLSGFLFCNV